MDRFYGPVANALALAGMILALLAAIARLGGAYTLFGFQSVSLFVAGTALVVVACFFKLQQLLHRIDGKGG